MSLERSILLLDESLNRSKRGLIRNRDDHSEMDLSISMTNSEMRKLLDQSALPNESTRNSSKLFPSNMSIAGSQVSVINKSKVLTDQLYLQFLEIIQSRSNENEIFETVQDLIEVLHSTAEEVSKFGQRKKEKFQTGDEIWLNHERNTWQLLFCLYKDRLLNQKEDMELDDLPLVNSEKTIVEHLYENNANLREYQLIVDWLEQTACEMAPSSVQQYTDRTVAWENTLHQLQNNALTVFRSNRELVKSLDPDAPVREKRSLHDLDMADEKRLAKQIFMELRQGKIENAQALCEHCGQPWRAAILEGWRLHHDENYNTNNPVVKEAIEGNPRRDLWKRCAWKMAENKFIDDYSRATVGVFCGHLDSLLNVMNECWSDILWSYLKVQIDIRVESEIRSYCVKSYLPMEEKYWNNKMSLENIFEELAAHRNINVKNEANDIVRVIQKYLILDEIPELLKHFENCISEENVSPQMLRFFTHIILFIRQIGRTHQEDIADKVIRSYVEYLITHGDHQLVAFYTAALPVDIQTILFSRYLETITETASRKKCLEEAMSYGLDVPTITTYTVEKIRNREIEAAGKEQEGDISELDATKISSLEWLTFNSEQRGELLWQANALIRHFVAQKNVEAAKNAFNTIPVDTIQLIINNYGSKDNLPCKDECSIKEYLCHQTYLAAIDGYNDWVECFYNMKPKPPQIFKSSNFTEKVASEHKEQQYKSDLERWKLQLNEQTNITRDLLYNILLFPDKGWLIDPDTTAKPAVVLDNEEWKNRQFQLEGLRNLCIPDVILLLHKIFTNAGHFKECLQLADIVSSEQRQLYTVIPKYKLAEIMTKIAESSLALMNVKQDPFVGDDASYK